MRLLTSIEDLEGVMLSAINSTRTLGGLPKLDSFSFEEEQKAAIRAPMAPEVIIAGAGTGKTTVMAARVAWLVGTGGVEARHILGLTFTRKAARKLARDIEAVLAVMGVDPEDAPTVSTYDGFAARLVSEWGAWLGVNSAVRLIESAVPYTYALQAVKQADGPYPMLARRTMSTIVKDVVRLDSQMQSHLVEPDTVEAYTRSCLADLAATDPCEEVNTALDVARERLELIDLCRRYRLVKEHRGVVEYADQMAQAVRLTRNVGSLGAEMRERHRLVLLDEYQDTSAAQANLLGGMFGVLAGVHDYPVTAVGDPLQAIYTWRGAAVDSIFAFHTMFPSEGQFTTSLSVNRRSSQKILDAANALTHTINDPLLPRTLRVELASAISEGPDSRVLARGFDTWSDEVEWIAESINADHEVWGRPWSETAILVRRRSEIDSLHKACVALGIPVTVQGMSGLLSTPFVAHIVSMLRIVNDPLSNMDLLDILTGPRFSWGADDVDMLGHRARQIAMAARSGDDGHKPAVRLMDAVYDPGTTPFSSRARLGMEVLRSDIGFLMSHRGHLMELCVSVAERVGVDVEASLDSNYSVAQVNQFLDHVSSFVSVSFDASLSGFLAYLDAETEFGSGFAREALTDDGVFIATVHQAKGLEWETVYLPALADSVFPENRLRDNPTRTASALPTAVRSDSGSLDQIGEMTKRGLRDYAWSLKDALRRAEDRLAYVAMTRPRRDLIATFHITREGRVTELVPSPYFGIISECASDKQEQEKLSVLSRVDAESMKTTSLPVDWPVSLAREGDTEAASAVQLAEKGKSYWESASIPKEVDDRIGEWDDIIASLARDEPRNAVIDVPLPTPLSASLALRAKSDSLGVATQLARPLPRKPSPSADLGAAFHAWVEKYYSQSTLPQLDQIVDWDIEELDRLKKGFLGSSFASAIPVAVEKDFHIDIAGTLVSGRIDAVFERKDNSELVPDGASVLIVDWKTGVRDPDPAQLGLYAYAWAKMTGVPCDSLRAGFFHVRDAKLNLVAIPSVSSLEAMIAGLDDSV